ncbi:MAG: hypothetical protein H7Y89_02945 [Steroidobacteraceae bacterium]|nr:hypothetical protein [Steroidobacteraceae bacterium]
MRYLAICILSLASMWSAASSPTAVAALLPHIEPSARDAALLSAQLSESPAMDPLLMLLVAGALGAIQLRRRQRSLRTPAPLRF